MPIRKEEFPNFGNLYSVFLFAKALKVLSDHLVRGECFLSLYKWIPSQDEQKNLKGFVRPLVRGECFLSLYKWIPSQDEQKTIFSSLWYDFN
jgi:hypothetical protein